MAKANQTVIDRGPIWTLFVTALLVAILGFTGLVSQPVHAQDADTSSAGPEDPFTTQGANSDSDFWRAIRSGERGTVANPRGESGLLIQPPGQPRNSEIFGAQVTAGQLWRDMRNNEVTKWGVYGMGGILVLLVLFFAIRGRIKIEHGKSGITIERFKIFERIGHWLTAGSFILLGLTGLNILYGKTVLMPVIGKSAFSAITLAGKYVHHYAAFAFMAGLVLIFLMWVRHNLPSRTDITWAMQGGGILSKGMHPPAKKFNAGQKVIFWLTILCGASLSLSGIALMWPNEFLMFNKTFVLLNSFGFSLPTDLSPIQEQQYAQLWHGMLSLFMICVILAHIYIGSIGMEGAFDAMGSGQVDLNWAKEHHSLWVEEVQEMQRTPPESRSSSKAPAE
ncbi:MAG: formate dehydrogenase subunit gamma [Alphaproteobacteria bacterium]